MLLECGHAQAYDIDPVSACSRGSECLGLAMIGLPQRGLYSSMENMQLTAFPTLKARDAATTVTSNFQLIYEPYGVARIHDKLAKSGEISCGSTGNKHECIGAWGATTSPAKPKQHPLRYEKGEQEKYKTPIVICSTLWRLESYRKRINVRAAIWTNKRLSQGCRKQKC